VIASYSMQPYHFSQEFGSLHTYGMPVIANQALYQVLEQKVANNIRYQEQKRDLYSAMKKEADELNLSVEVKEKILATVREKLMFNPDVDYIYISPRGQNHEMFFADHFSLNPQILEKIVRVGFRSGLHFLKSVI